MDINCSQQPVETEMQGINDVDLISMDEKIVIESNLTSQEASEMGKSINDYDFVSENTVSEQDASIMCITITDTESEDEKVKVQLQQLKAKKQKTSAKRIQSANGKKKKNKSTRIECSSGMCREKFESAEAMAYHKKIYHAKGIKKKFQCYLCKKLITTRIYLLEHINRVHSRQSRFKCPFLACTRIFYGKSQLQTHIKVGHAEQKVPKPDRSKPKKSCIVRNKQSNDNFSIKCHWNCKNVFESMDAMMYHAKDFHARGIKRTFECHLCKKVSARKEHLETHIVRIHSRRASLPCPFPACARMFYVKQDLRTHIINVHDGKTEEAQKQQSENSNGCDNNGFSIKCQKNCEEYFESLDAMVHHLNVFHTKGIKNTFECHLCKQKRSDKTSIRRHLNSFHSHQNVFKCPLPTCSKVFYGKVDLKMHLRNRHPKQQMSPDKRMQSKNARVASNKRISKRFPVVCSIGCCKEHFECRPTLAYHVKTYHSKGSRNTFECHLCKFSTSSKYGLRDHMNRQHSHRISYACPVTTCPRFFFGTNTLKAHIRNHHKIKADSPLMKIQPENGGKSNSAKLPIQCKLQCREFFESREAMMQHLKFYHAKGFTRTFECYLCKTMLSSRDSLQEHINRLHIRQVRFMCPFATCSRVFYGRSELILHLRIGHVKGAESKNVVDNDRNNGNFHVKCARHFCDDLFQTKAAAFYHDQHYHKRGVQRKFECHLCKEAMGSRLCLQWHMNAKHSPQQDFKCPFPGCKRVSYCEQYVKNHIKYVHNKKRKGRKRTNRNGSKGRLSKVGIIFKVEK